MNIPAAHQLLFLDLETVSLHPSFDALDETGKEMWTQKVRFQLSDTKTAAELYTEKAGVMAEFSKIICATVGYLTLDAEEKSYKLKLKSFFGDNEKQLLEEMLPVLNSVGTSPLKLLCAHNGNEFDFPFLARRLVINQLPLPNCLDLAGKKPWQIPHIDTMELWKFGDRKAYTSLNLLAYIFEIPSPKDDISGSDVHHVYYDEKNLERIVFYCEKDVTTLIKLYLKFANKGESISAIESNTTHD